MWNFGIKDAIDILAVAGLLYYIYRKTRENGTIVMFQGIVAVLFLWLLVSQVLEMRLLGGIMDSVMSVSVIIIIVLFQNEIRQALIRMGSRRQWEFLLRFFGQEELQKEDATKWVDALVLACRNMSEQKVGALIVIQRNDLVNGFINSGCEVDALVSTRLIEQIFYKNTPLHDGAMVISHGRIVLAAGVLPVSHNKRIPPELGLRHRSALGISEVCDARVIVVSEETGGITVAQRGRFYRDLTPLQLQKMLLKE